MAQPAPAAHAAAANANQDAGAKEIIKAIQSPEIWFGVVGPVGAGGSRAIASLKKACEEKGYDVQIIKMSSLIREWAEAHEKDVPPQGMRPIDSVPMLQNLGDEIRKIDPAGVGRLCLSAIARRRAELTGANFVQGEAVQPDETKRAWLIDSIRHPAETQLFRRAYGASFALVGVVCEESVREKRIIGKFLTNPEKQDAALVERVKDFISRDADDERKSYGQHVTSAFYEADFFVDNTLDDETDEKGYLEEPLARLVSIVTHDRLVRPTIEETAMHHAHSARVRSACLSRQVGAALVDHYGTVVSTGTNEVPRAGGGVYGEQFSGNKRTHEHRCAFRNPAFCSNNVEQNAIVDDLIAQIPELSAVDDAEKGTLRAKIRRTRLGGLIEFSRAVHAEMDALLSAGREGTSTVGTRLFVTTFPCHYCARHIVSAGVYEVQFIEPYPKSLALSLHIDAIAVSEDGWVPPSTLSIAEERALEPEEDQGRVLFKPFVGVAPRLYLKAFEKVRDLKDKVTGDMKIGEPEWGDEWSPLVSAYPEIEAALTKNL
jgi:deoxycytidylate deaminase